MDRHSNNNSRADNDLLTREILDRLKSQGADIAHIKEILAGWTEGHRHLADKVNKHDRDLEPIVKAHHWSQVTLRLLATLATLAALAMAATRLNAEESSEGPRLGIPVPTAAAIVKVVMRDGLCTGFVIDANRILTAAHCAEMGETGEILFTSGRKAPFKVLHRGKPASATDVELLEAETKDNPTLSLGLEPVHQFVGAFLSSRRGPPTAYVGVAIGVDPDKLGRGVGWVLPGDSGSPLLDEFGDVQGIVVMMQRGRPVFFFVTLEQIKALLSR